MKMSHILIVDDDDDDRSILPSGFMENNSETLTYKDGLELLDYLNREAEVLPGLIILDFDMPKITGLELLKTLKKDNRLKQIPVVILSSHNPATRVAECIQSGAAAYYVKPFSFSKIIRLIKDQIIPFSKQNSVTAAK